MSLSTPLKNSINQIIANEFGLVKNKLINIDFNDQYITKLVKEVTSTSKNGKLLRPILTLLIGKLAPSYNDIIKSNIVNMSIAIELLHTASLIHDDIVDNATYRRGEKSFNNLYGNDMAVMMGDIIFAKSAMYVCETKNIEVVNKFANTIIDLSMGQLHEMNSRNDLSQDKNNYFYRIEKKTASLFETATWSGGELAGFDQNHSDMLKNFGKNLGYAFQIFDDIKDFTELESQNISGKNVGLDISNGIFTLPIILSFEQDRKNNPVNLYNLKNKAININQLRIYLSDNDFITKSVEIGNEYINKAKTSLAPFEFIELKNILYKIADSIKSN